MIERFSSLNYLNRLPVNVLKIDRSFVQQSVISQKGTRMIHSIMDLARNFDLLVIAEGVEDQEQMDTLTRLGCRLIQGFHFSRPLDEEAAVVFLGKHDD